MIPLVVIILGRLAIGDFVKLFCESVVAFSGSAAGVDLPNRFDVQRSVVVRTRFGALQITPSILGIRNIHYFAFVGIEERIQEICVMASNEPYSKFQLV